MLPEISDGHLSTKYKCDRNCEESNNEQQTPERLKAPRYPDQRQKRRLAAGSTDTSKESKQLLQSVQGECESGNNPQERVVSEKCVDEHVMEFEKELQLRGSQLVMS